MLLLLYPDPGPRWRAALAGAAPGVELLVTSDPAEAVQLIAEADALYGNLTPAMLQAAHQLRWVQTSMAGLERYMFPELVASSLTLTNARGIYSDVIADHVFACVLAFARDLPRLLRAQQEGRWLREAQVQAFQLQGMTAGIVGFGGIGSEVARRAQVTGMAVLAVDPAPHAEVDGVLVWGPERLDDLLARSDFVVVCAPETPETRGLFNAERFAKMKRGARFINVGRGMVVQLHALTDALQRGQLAGAALDVYETEPLPPDHPLWGMENVLLTPHSAAYAVPAEERRLALVVDNVRRFVAGEPLRNVVAKERWS
ncbi:MAG TPA: D-2-hydroxyacid dehydrogenase [Chloroflexota bacterium]